DLAGGRPFRGRVLGGQRFVHGSARLAHSARRKSAAPIVTTRAMRLYAVDRTTRRPCDSVDRPSGVVTKTCTGNRPVVLAWTPKISVVPSPGIRTRRDEPCRKVSRFDRSSTRTSTGCPERF